MNASEDVKIGGSGNSWDIDYGGTGNDRDVKIPYSQSPNIQGTKLNPNGSNLSSPTQGTFNGYAQLKKVGEDYYLAFIGTVTAPAVRYIFYFNEEDSDSRLTSWGNDPQITITKSGQPTVTKAPLKYLGEGSQFGPKKDKGGIWWSYEMPANMDGGSFSLYIGNNSNPSYSGTLKSGQNTILHYWNNNGRSGWWDEGN